MGISGRKKLHRFESVSARGALSIVCAGHLNDILNDGRSFSWVPPGSSGSSLGLACKFDIETAAFDVSEGTKG